MSSVNLMPMAGKGNRFKNNNYLIHKPLIKINGKPMFLNAAKCMPLASKWLFVYRSDSKKKIYLGNKLPLRLKRKSKLIYLQKDTLGQADTCLQVKNYITPKTHIFIHSCDSYIKFDKKKYFKLIKKYDAIIFTTKPNNYHFKNIKSFGWVSGRGIRIKNIECKKKASNDIKKDFVIIGTFAFNNKDVLLNSIKNIITNKIKINNEYYLDSALKDIFDKGLKVFNYVVDEHVSWGTPDELDISQTDG